MERVRVFVAMAYGRTDVEEWFRYNLTPILQKRNLSVRRADQIVGTRDLDDQVVAELQRADLVVADLTYSSRAVYYEAGLADGMQIPVIYTARADHVPDSADQDLKIHFNLSMKNLVRWRAPRDPRFDGALSKRLGIALRPILIKRDEEEAYSLSRAQYARLSVADRWRASVQTLGSAVVGSRVFDCYPDFELPSGYPPRRHVIGSKRFGSTVWTVQGLAPGFPLTAKEARVVKNLVMSVPANLQPSSDGTRLQALRDLHILLSLDKVRAAALAGRFSEWALISEWGLWLQAQCVTLVPTRRVRGVRRVIPHDRGPIWPAGSPSSDFVGITQDGALREVATKCHPVPRILDVVVVDCPRSMLELELQVKSVLDLWRNSEISVSEHILERIQRVDNVWTNRILPASLSSPTSAAVGSLRTKLKTTLRVT